MASRLDFSQIRSLYIGTSSSTTVDTNNLIVVGNVGIGTTSPSEKLHVLGGNTDTVGQIRVGGNAVEYVSGIDFYTATSSRGFIGWRGVNSGAPYNAYGMYLLNYDNSPIIFGTATGNEKMRINDNGNVGINSTNPGAKLEVISANLGGTAGDQTLQALFSTSNGNGSYLEFKDVRTSTGADWTYAAKRIQMRIDSTYMGYVQFNGTGNDAGISFGTGATTTAPGNVAEKMRITSAGNVGIGTTAPVSALSVVGKTNLGNQASGFYVTPSTLHIASSTVSQISFEDYVITAAIAIAGDTFAFGHQNASPSYEFKYSNTYNGNYATTGTTFARFNPTTSYISAGNVGIGTTSPSDYSLLHVNLPNNKSARFGSWEINTFTVNNAWLGENVYFDGSNFKYRNNGYANLLYSDAAGGFQIRMTNGTGTAGDTISTSTNLSIKPNGNVQIGSTTDAGYKLDVNGTFRAVGQSYFNADVTFPSYYRTIGLPYFEMGGGGINDEYLLLIPKYSSGFANPYLIMGELKFQRGSTTTGNDPSVTKIVAQTAYNVTYIYQYSVTGAQVWTSIDVLSISGVEWYALKARPNGGGPAYVNQFVGNFIDSGSQMLTRVRLSDSGVSLVTANAYLPTINNWGQLTLRGSSGDSPLFTLAGPSYTMVSMGDRSSSSATDIGYISVFNGATQVIDIPGNSDKVYFNNGGNFLIGTTTDAGYKLDVNGSTRVQGNLITTGRQYVQSTPVNIKLPWSSLSVNGTAVSDAQASDGTAGVRYSASGNDTFFYGPYQAIDAGSYVARFRIKVASNASASYIGYIDVVGTNISGEAVSLRPNMLPTGGDYYYIDVPFNCNNDSSVFETRWIGWVTGITDTYIDHVLIVPQSRTNNVYVTDGDSYTIYEAQLPRLFIQNGTGRIGVGTTNPNQRLSVEGGSIQMNADNAAANYYLFLNKKNGQDGGILFNRDNGNDWQLTNVTNNGNLLFYSYGTATEAITFTKATGNVLIGTTTDTGARLRIVGGPLTLNLGTAANAAAAFQFGDDSRALTYMPTVAGGQYNWASVTNGSALFNTLGSDWWVGNHDGSAVRFVQNSSIVFYHNSSAQGVYNSTGLSIGNTSPQGRLHISFPASAGATSFIMQTSDGGGNGTIRWRNNGGTDQAGIGSNYNIGDSGALEFLNGGTTNMILRSSGNLGIGTTDPNTPLSSSRGIVINSGASNDVQIRMQNNTTGSAGSDGGLLSISGSQMYLWNYEASNLIFGTNNSERMRIDSSGNIGIGTTSISYRVDISGDARILSGSLGVGVAPNATDGRIDASNDIVAYSTSDQRLKENVTPIENALEKVKTLTGVEFDWKEETAHVHGYHGHDVGIIAQDVQAVLPEAVRTNESGYLSVRYEKMIALLIEGMKEQQNQIDELKAKLDGLTR